MNSNQKQSLLVILIWIIIVAGVYWFFGYTKLDNHSSEQVNKAVKQYNRR